MPALSLASYKLRLHEGRVRAMPAPPFAGPGVDLAGDDARAAIAAARPVLAWLDAREPGVVVRSISVRIAGPRILVSAESPTGGRPRALRFDPPYADELREAGREAERLIGELAARSISRRGPS